MEVRNGTYSLYFRIAILVCLLYFLIIEVAQLSKQGFMLHFMDFWNYLDITIPLMILSTECLNYLGYLRTSFCDYVQQHTSEEELECEDYILVRCLYSLIAFLMWIRFIYFFRVFKRTGYYIRMIIEVIKDMRQFFLIFVTSVIAFSQANYILTLNGFINTSSESKSIFEVMVMSYRDSIGDLQASEINYYTSSHLQWIFLILCTLFEVVVLLNLLIAIVANTFERVQTDK